MPWNRKRAKASSASPQGTSRPDQRLIDQLSGVYFSCGHVGDCRRGGWDDQLIRSLLQGPDSDTIRRSTTGGYTRGLYKRDRVVAVAQSTEGRAAKQRWDETLRADRSNPGWTARLGDIGKALGITAGAAGKILGKMGYRSDSGVTDRAIAVGCGVRRWNGFTFHDDWHLDRVLAAIRLAAEATDEPAVADALAAAIVRHQVTERAAARKRKQAEIETAFRQEEEAVIFGLQIELRALRYSDPGMSLLTAVEYITPDPAHRIALYRLCGHEDRSVRFNGIDQAALVSIASVVDKDLAFLERRAEAEGFQV